ncbi:uncharacterized protein LOC123411895 [Hordeum vulgare subsp. vulgare]|uniref:SAWADEE domain-containing protein n=2 Tax=Hordeum vulgare subsp. vulgare TaxID=112509 RepID=A0A8I6X3Q3_HORVV|nr:uncharacterized protein LOC123411895 [Hordeum vulgare subsp. vulgare]
MAMPTPRKQKAPAPPRRAPPRMEYRAKDGAWYSARVALQDESLRVMFEEFLEEFDEWHEPNAADLASPRDVAALRARFRPASPPLEDARCGDLRRGQHLCVFRAISDGERMYYDAVLDSVKRAAHVTVDGEERCACRFKVRWTDGPLSGGWDDVGVGEVCCVQDSTVQDPALSEFLDRVTKSFGFCDGEESAKAEQGSPVQEPRLSEFLDRVTKSFRFRDGEDNAKAAAAAAQGSGALSPLGGEENATAAPQATGATSLWGGEGKTAWIIIG